MEEPRNVGFEGFGFGGFGVGGHEEGHGVRIFDAGNGGSFGDFQGEFEGAGSLRSSTDRAVTRSTGTPASDAEVLTAVDENSGQITTSLRSILDTSAQALRLPSGIDTSMVDKLPPLDRPRLLVDIGN